MRGSTHPLSFRGVTAASTRAPASGSGRERQQRRECRCGDNAAVSGVLRVAAGSRPKQRTPSAAICSLEAVGCRTHRASLLGSSRATVVFVLARKAGHPRKPRCLPSLPHQQPFARQPAPASDVPEVTPPSSAVPVDLARRWGENLPVSFAEGGPSPDTRGTGLRPAPCRDAPESLGRRSPRTCLEPGTDRCRRRTCRLEG